MVATAAKVRVRVWVAQSRTVALDGWVDGAHQIEQLTPDSPPLPSITACTSCGERATRGLVHGTGTGRLHGVWETVVHTHGQTHGHTHGHGHTSCFSTPPPLASRECVSRDSEPPAKLLGPVHAHAHTRTACYTHTVHTPCHNTHTHNQCTHNYSAHARPSPSLLPPL
jgi:hypothetical protein